MPQHDYRWVRKHVFFIEIWLNWPFKLDCTSGFWDRKQHMQHQQTPQMYIPSAVLPVKLINRCARASQPTVAAIVSVVQHRPTVRYSAEDHRPELPHSSGTQHYEAQWKHLRRSWFTSRNRHVLHHMISKLHMHNSLSYPGQFSSPQNDPFLAKEVI